MFHDIPTYRQKIAASETTNPDFAHPGASQIATNGSMLKNSRKNIAPTARTTENCIKAKKFFVRFAIKYVQLESSLGHVRAASPLDPR